MATTRIDSQAGHAFSLAELYTKVAAKLPALLIPQENISKVREFVDLLPSNLPVDTLIFEFALNSRKQNADISFSVRMDDERSEALFCKDSLPIKLQDDDAWKFLVRFLEKVAAEGIFKKNEMEALWFEFDVCSNPKWPPAPNLGFGSNSKEKNFALEGLSFFKNETVERILSCASKHDFRVLVMGVMLARAPEWIKIVFRKNSPDSIAPFLRNIGYGYSIAPVIELINKIRHSVHSICLQIDLHKTRLSPKIGLECRIPGAYAPFRWQPFLEVLASERLITEEERHAITTWLGGSRFTSNGSTHSVIRYISYFKLIYEPEKPVEIKLYLGAFFQK